MIGPDVLTPDALLAHLDATPALRRLAEQALGRNERPGEGQDHRSSMLIAGTLYTLALQAGQAFCPALDEVIADTLTLIAARPAARPEDALPPFIDARDWSVRPGEHGPVLHYTDFGGQFHTSGPILEFNDTNLCFTEAAVFRLEGR